jgi:hypothetical protein
MRDNDIRRPAQELEILVAEGRLRTRINASSTYASVPFDIDDRLSALRVTYEELDSLARQKNQGRKYREVERELGELLAGILLQDVPGLARDRQIGAVLEACLGTLRDGEYVRLLLSFENPRYTNLPWELALWKVAGREICLGRDRRIALSRLEHGRAGIRRKHALGNDGVLSLLHIGIIPPAVATTTDPAAGGAEFKLTRAFLGLIDDHITRLHATSRSSAELDAYWLDSNEITGRPSEVDIVHWDSHGGTTLDRRSPKGDIVDVAAAELLERTQHAFLYVVRACDVVGEIPDSGPPSTPPRSGSSFSVDLLEAGAPAVLGTHDRVEPKELAYLPIIYPLLFQGLPLDYCVQYMRRFFARLNSDSRNGPYDRWYKLILRTTSTWYLDAGPACSPLASSRSPIATVAALWRKFKQLEGTYVSGQVSGFEKERRSPGRGDGGVADREELDEVLKQLYSTELLD